MAIADGLTEANPVTPKWFAKEKNERVRLLTSDEESRLRGAMSEAAWTKVDLALHTGLRRGEQLGLRGEHVDFTVGIITIPRSKSGKTRRVPMNDAARDLLRSLPSRLKSAWVLPAEDGRKPLNAKNFAS